MDLVRTFMAIVGWIAAGMALCGVAYTAAAALATTRFMRRPSVSAAHFPDVTVIKPLHGAHAKLAGTLEHFCAQDYAGRLQILFGVHDAADPAVAVVQALRARHPDVDIELVVDPRLYGANRKASNLANIAARAKYGVLILSDADIVVGTGYLRTVVAALEEPGVGAVSCLYVGENDGSLWSRLSAMAIDYQFLPSAVLGRALGMAHPCFGSTIALRAEVLDRIGGFVAFADQLADDYEIGRAVRALGLRIAFPPMVVSHLSPENSARELISHELRWSRTVRQIDASGHAGSVVTHPLPLALLASALLSFSPPTLVLIALVLAARVMLKLAVDHATTEHAGAWWLIPARDVLSFGIFIGGFAVNTVGWQGRRFHVGPDGVLSHS